jgi:type 1 fimbriae regulatory protein FimB/type 1 fimbriae regulatory protein FimE
MLLGPVALAGWSISTMSPTRAMRSWRRASEIADLEWSQVELGRAATLHVRRVKNGKPSAHPLRGDEVRALRELRRQSPDAAGRSRPMPSTGSSSGSARACFAFPVHVHMLRHERLRSRIGSAIAPSSTRRATRS